MIVGGGAAFGLSLVNSFKRVVSPALVLAFCVAEGIALGAISKFFDAQFGDNIIMNAVLGTFGAFAGTLAAYKYFNIKVGAKFRTFVIAAMFGMVGLSLMELVLSMFGAGTGLFGVSGLGMVTAFAGLALGIFMLILDFDMIEQGIAAGVDERESWRVAFALTVSLVWIYTNLLRILAFFSRTDQRALPKGRRETSGPSASADPTTYLGIALSRAAISARLACHRISSHTSSMLSPSCGDGRAAERVSLPART